MRVASRTAGIAGIAGGVLFCLAVWSEAVAPRTGAGRAAAITEDDENEYATVVGELAEADASQILEHLPRDVLVETPDSEASQVVIDGTVLAIEADGTIRDREDGCFELHHWIDGKPSRQESIDVKAGRFCVRASPHGELEITDLEIGRRPGRLDPGRFPVPGDGKLELRARVRWTTIEVVDAEIGTRLAGFTLVRSTRFDGDSEIVIVRADWHPDTRASVVITTNGTAPYQLVPPSRAKGEIGARPSTRWPRDTHGVWSASITAGAART